MSEQGAVALHDIHAASASGTAMLINCPGSHLLRRVGKTTSRSLRGSIVHAFLAKAVADPASRDQYVLEVPEQYREYCDSLDVSGCLYGVKPGLATEQAFMLDLRDGSAKCLGQILDRKYPERTVREIPCTVDVFGILGDNTPMFLDWKSSLDIGPIQHNWQMRTCAAAVLLATGATEVECRVAYYRDDGCLDMVPHIFTAFDVEGYVNELSAAVNLVEREARRQLPLLATGDWCTYCPCLTGCPAHTSLASNLIGELGDLASALSSGLSDEDAGRAWRKAKTAERVVLSVLDSLKTRARARRFPLGGGKAVGEITTSKTAFDSPKARRLIKALGATEAEMGGLYRKASFKMVRELNTEEETE